VFSRRFFYRFKYWNRVGDNGIIIRTTDGGNYWTKQSSGITLRLSGVEFINENLGIAVGESGTILRVQMVGVHGCEVRVILLMNSHWSLIC